MATPKPPLLPCFIQGIQKPLPDVKKKLEQIASDQINQFEKFHQKCDLNAAEIFQILNNHSRYTISRAKIVGGKGIGNSISNSSQSQESVIKTHDDYNYDYEADFNLVLFVIDQTPPFNKVLKDFQKTLENFGKHHNLSFQCKTDYSIKFKMRDCSKFTSSSMRNSYISFDIIPAMNLVLSFEEEGLGQDEIEEIQTYQALKWISELQDPRQDIQLYNYSLTERYVSFVKSQSPFVHKVIRLAKLWNQKVSWKSKEKLYGRSIIIELVAISVALFEEVDSINDETEPVLSEAFVMFLKKFIRFDACMFELFKCPGNSNLKLPYERYVQETCDLGRPIILDPVNPFHNYAVYFTVEMKMAFKVHAKVTLKAIQNYREYSKAKFFNFEGYFGI